MISTTKHSPNLTLRALKLASRIYVEEKWIWNLKRHIFVTLKLCYLVKPQILLLGIDYRSSGVSRNQALWVFGNFHILHEPNILHTKFNTEKCSFIDGQNSDDIQQAAQQLHARWVEFCSLLAERLAWLAYQTKVLAFYNLFHNLEQMVANSENWLKIQQPPACEPEPLRIQLERCRVTICVFQCAWGPIPL